MFLQLKGSLKPMQKHKIYCNCNSELFYGTFTAVLAFSLELLQHRFYFQLNQPQFVLYHLGGRTGIANLLAMQHLV